MALKIGITGGIGSGKSTVCKIFRLLGIPVFDADSEAKLLLDNDTIVKEKLVHLFGEGIYTHNGSIDRKKLATLIFNNDLLLQKVNGIVHPAVREKFFTWSEKQVSVYILHEAAILFESGFYKLMDFNILITANQELRIQRVMNRDGVSREKVLERLKKQWPDEEKAKLADAVINNDNGLLIPQILEIDKKLRENGKIW